MKCGQEEEARKNAVNEKMHLSVRDNGGDYSSLERGKWLRLAATL